MTYKGAGWGGVTEGTAGRSQSPHPQILAGGEQDEHPCTCTRVHPSSGEGEGAVPEDSHLWVPVVLALQAHQKCSLLSSPVYRVLDYLAFCPSPHSRASLVCLYCLSPSLPCPSSNSCPFLSLHLFFIFPAPSFHVPHHSQIPRYILTLHELLAHTPHEHVERNSLDYAKSKLEELSR